MGVTSSNRYGRLCEKRTKATEIAYIMCDKRMPTGVSLPEMNHDWNTLTLEEAKIGRPFSKLTRIRFCTPISLKKLGLQEVAVQIIAADNKRGSVPGPRQPLGLQRLVVSKH